MTGARVLLFATGACTLLIGCIPLKSLFKISSADSPPSTSGNAQPQPEVSNAFAYARYAALNLETAASNKLSPESVERILLENAEKSGLSTLDMVEVLADKPPQPSSPEKGTSVLRFEEFSAQMKTCASRNFSFEDCCRGLAWPMSQLPQLTNLDPSRMNELREDAKRSVEKRQQLLAWKGTSYRLAGLKAWLAACHTVLTKAPENINLFKNEFASTLNQKELWTRSLHAKSRAKRGPRRIYARADGLISIAETLDANCQIMETEVIRRRTDGSLDYWVYDSRGQLTPVSHFPAPDSDKGFKTVEKLSPDSCMGCHYDFESRQFDQLKVSADLLKLPGTSHLPVVCAQPGEALAEDN